MCFFSYDPVFLNYTRTCFWRIKNTGFTWSCSLNAPMPKSSLITFKINFHVRYFLFSFFYKISLTVNLISNQFAFQFYIQLSITSANYLQCLIKLIVDGYIFSEALQRAISV